MPRFLLCLALAGTFFLPPLAARAQKVALPVTFHRQEHSLSCEVASLKTALKIFGIEVSEAELISRLPFDATPKSPGVWGDPNKGFVGNINGTMLGTGYGVYAGPIAQIANRYVRAEILNSATPQDIAKAISAGRPVIMWGYYGSGAPSSWQTPAGTPVKAVNGEHTRVVFGYDGPARNPTRFYLMDPITGSFSLAAAEFLRNWNSLDNMALVLSPRWVRLPGGIKIWEIDQSGTRHWVTSWSAFVRRGGSKEAVVTLPQSELNTYPEGAEIN